MCSQCNRQLPQMTGSEEFGGGANSQMEFSDSEDLGAPVMTDVMKELFDACEGFQAGKVSAGQKLALASSASKTVAANERKQTRQLAARENKPVAKNASAVTRYKVRRGDTLYSIARQFKVEANDLMRWNGVSAKTLTPGKTLTIQLARNP